MRVLSLLLLAPALAAALDPEAVENDSTLRNRRSGAIKGVRKLNQIKAKVDKSKPQSPHKSEEPPDSPPTRSKKNGSCTTQTIYYLLNEFQGTFIENKVGGVNNEVNVYDARTRLKVATYIEIATSIANLDCYYNGVFTFHRDNQGRPVSQIFTASTCSGQQAAVIGGTGQYQLAQGYVAKVTRGGPNKIFFDVYVCV
jgi:hypothetical protein